MGIFKAYDIRGLVPAELNEQIAWRIGYAFAELISRDSAGGAGKTEGKSELGTTLVVGRDMRSHSPAIAGAVIEGIRAAGASVIDIGLASTPMAYFAIGTLPCDGGLNVTASHNGPKWNGFKLCRSGARPVSYETGIGALEKRVLGSEPMPKATKTGGLRTEEMLHRYGDHLMRFTKRGAPRKILCDAANGMAGLVLPELAPRMQQNGVELAPKFWELDGNFPNHEANPLKDDVMEIVAKDVRAAKGKYHAAASFDGDADRCAFVDETGTPIPNDLMTALIARELLRSQPGAVVVYDLRSSWVVPETIAKSGGRPMRVRVGHSFIKETMRKESAIFGGELSGHYYWKDHFYCDSAMVALSYVVGLLASSETPLSERVRDLRKYFATGEINFEVHDKAAAIAGLKARFGKEATRMDDLDGVTVEFGTIQKAPWWWFNVRVSNTEPLLRLNLEASDAKLREEKRALLISILGTPSKH
jgi:phosphomannomutase